MEKQDTYQAFVSGNIDFTDTTRLHLEALYAKTEVPNAGATPTGATTRLVSETALTLYDPDGTFRGTSPTNFDPRRASFFYIPIENPGFAGAFAPGAGYVPTGATAGYIQVGTWRPYLSTGNPAYDDGTQRYNFERDNMRVAAELTGEIGSVNWLTSLSYGQTNYIRQEADISTGKLQLALRGFGGASCNGVRADLAGSTCEWFNPFSNSFASTADGTANPNFVGAGNSRALLQWLEDDMENHNKTSNGEFNLVFSGDMPVSLPGGQIGWAAGAQYRHTWLDIGYNSISSRATNPCVDTPITGSTTCFPTGESPYNFLATYAEQDLDRGVYAGFGELSLPVTDSLNAQLAARFEDYGNKGGSSFDPKLSVKYQIIDQLALRGSVGTTFRAPPQQTLVTDPAIAFSTILGASRPVQTAGNPNLEPEESFQWSAGAVLTLGNFRALVDFWRFDIDKILTTEPAAGVAALVFPTATGPNNCATVDPAFLAARFVFANNTCAVGNILQINVSNINGAGLRNDGIDLTMDYTFDNLLGGSLTLGASGTWIHEYKTETLVVNGQVAEVGFDGVGFLNQGTTLFALPEWRAQAYLDFNFGQQNVRWTTNFVDQYRDQRDGINRDGRTFGNLFTAASPDGRIVDSAMVHNVTYKVDLPRSITLLGTVENVFDEDPSFARLELNYDPLTGLPLGRTYKLGFRMGFE